MFRVAGWIAALEPSAPWRMGFIAHFDASSLPYASPLHLAGNDGLTTGLDVDPLLILHVPRLGNWPNATVHLYQRVESAITNIIEEW